MNHPHNTAGIITNQYRRFWSNTHGNSNILVMTKESSKKTPLSKEQIADAARLKTLWQAKKSALGLTQEKAAEKLGGISQGGVSHYLNGINALNINAAVVFAELLHVPVGHFSPSLEEERLRLAMDTDKTPGFDDPRIERLLEEVKDFSKSDLSELLAQIELIKRRKRGDL
jgi:transcriptional regulator with XRE-family HTH domain